MQLLNIVKYENALLKKRLERLHKVGTNEIMRLRVYAEKTLYPKLDEWLGLRIKGESAAIETLSFLFKSAIEREEPLYFRHRLEGEDVFIDKDLIAHPLPMLPDSSHFSDVCDPSLASRFTPAQLLSLGSRCKDLASQAWLNAGDLSLLLIRTASRMLHHGEVADTIPPVWANFDRGQFTRVASVFDPEDTERVDWRHLIVCLALPEPLSTPTLSQLKQMKADFRANDKDSDGKLTYREFLDVTFWFEDRLNDLPAGKSSHSRPQRNTKSISVGGGEEEEGESGIQQLKTTLFQLFSVPDADDHTLLLQEREAASAIEEGKSDIESSSSRPATAPKIYGEAAQRTNALNFNTLAVDDLLPYLCFDSANGATGPEKLAQLIPGNERSPVIKEFLARAGEKGQAHVFVRKNVSKMHVDV
jgi:hypothetical protein